QRATGNRTQRSRRAPWPSIATGRVGWTETGYLPSRVGVSVHRREVPRPAPPRRALNSRGFWLRTVITPARRTETRDRAGDPAQQVPLLGPCDRRPNCAAFFF